MEFGNNSVMSDDLPRDLAVAGLSAVIIAANGYRLAASEHFHLDVVETHAIGYLNARGPMSQSQLARLIGLSGGAVTGLVDRLERRGTARRVVDDHDRRRNRIELTDQARKILAESDASLARTFDHLAPDVVQTLIKALPQLAEGLDREAQAMRH